MRQPIKQLASILQNCNFVKGLKKKKGDRQMQFRIYDWILNLKSQSHEEDIKGMTEES